ncbi:MAG: sulfurtransferase [Xanthomonadales bacterium]|nr:MAG: sulfurtransferase [Dokdonella sp.]MBC6943253.1 sulfurtransferase [Xanthomonadales bacterium]MBW7926085.1 sulfurtransferase [Burkholderiaceae bacterium]MDL1868424.1 sulfurtransferase [Gammaproteobacteria bacterium PRO6]
MTASVLIGVDALAALLPRGDVLVVDCRFELSAPDQGERDYLDAHIPGAVYAHLDRDLSDHARQGQGRHPLPDAQRFAATLSRWGWQPGLRVVAYDNAGGALAAARLWWMLRLVGAHEAQVLDGGWSAWCAANLPRERGATARGATTVSVRLDEAAMVDYAQLQRHLAAADIVLLDARGPARFRGDEEPLDRVGGHIPGARNRPFALNLDGSGRFKPATELRREFEDLLGTHAPAAVVHSCGSGVTACHNLLAMEHAGLHGSRLFAPSWSGWISDPARPVATGAAD